VAKAAPVSAAGCAGGAGAYFRGCRRGSKECRSSCDGPHWREGAD